ncbi:MAG: DsrE/DsrF/DrsH-like family protein [candidate division WOR-3 bacterium]|nr:DsrE/DsrF/DrsH-like family protein [candidate division WOR-3 bacterium]
MKDKMTIILFSGDFDKAIAAFTLATTAAASGMEVSIFFTYWGLNVLKRTTFTISKSQNFIQRLFNIISPAKLPLSKLNMFGLGPWVMKKLMKKTKVASLEDLMKLAKELGVKYIACTTSCSVLGLDRKNLIDEIDEFAGASTYLAEAKDSKINLFI